MLRQDHEWWDYLLWRETRTSFFTLAPYKVISFFRRWASDILALTPLVAAGVWWVTVSSGTDIPADAVSTPDSVQVFLLSHHVSRFYPTLIAFLLCVIILRAGRTATPRRRARSKISLAGRISLALVIVPLILAVLDLVLVPGSFGERALPCVVAAAWGWLIRSQVYGRVRVLEATDAGFRPPARIAFSRRSRRFAKKCLTSAWRYQQDMPAERAGIDEAISFFAGRRNSRALGWCVARAVDYNLRASALDEAEAVLGRLDTYPALNDEPCVRAAQGLFERATDSGAARSKFADAEQLCRDKRRRVPYRLRALKTEAELAQAVDGGVTHRWSARARVFLTWNRDYGAVLRDILAMSVQLWQRDPQAAIVLASRIMELAGDLGKASAMSDLTPHEATSLLLVKAAARVQIGDMLTAQQRFQGAATAYALAVAHYREAKYRPGAGLAAVRAAVLALRAGVSQTVKEESDLLAGMLTGLQEIEFDRGRLRGPEYRASLLAARDRTYSEVFAVLADRRLANRDKAAEIALWLLESVHRNALAETIQANQAAAGDSAAEEALRRLREPADVAGIRQVVTGRAALYYRCERTESGWLVTALLVAPSGISMRQTLLPLPPSGTVQYTAMRKFPAALLDELASGDPDRVSFVHTNFRLDVAVWAELAQALLPPELAEALRSLESPGGPAILLVVPDGPLSSVPFAGLRLADGSAVADHAAVVFMPNLLAFSANEWTGELRGGECTAVAHFGPTRFRDAFEWERSRSPIGIMPVIVRATPDRESFVAELGKVPVPRIAVISNHGETAANPADRFIHFEGGGQLSELDAERISWPQTVVLGSCWASDITVRAGDDPVGLPTACLLGGARVVLGGQSRVDNDETSARILARVTLDAAAGQHPALTLQSAISDHLAAYPADRGAPSAQWANMTVWTSQPPPGPRPAAPRWESWTTELTARPPGEDRFAVFNLSVIAKDPKDRRNPQGFAVRIGQAVQRAVEHAAGSSPAGKLTTLDVLAAIFATDPNPDWMSFAASADLPALPGPGSARDGSQETEDTNSTLRFGPDREFPVTAVVLRALRWGERLTSHLRDPVIAPAHLVYGFLCEKDCDAARWAACGGHDPADLRNLLSDRMFSVDLPAPEELPKLKQKPASANLVRPQTRNRKNPKTSSEVFDLITANSRPVLSTLDFAGAAAAANGTAWQTLAGAGLRPAPPDGDLLRERDHGGQEITLGDSLLATVTREFAQAFKNARALAWHRGDPEVLPEHLLYGIVSEQDCDGARWLRVAPGSPTVLEVLSECVFRSPLPVSYRLPTPPKPQAKEPVGLLPLLGQLSVIGLLLFFLVLVPKIYRGVLSLAVFGLLIGILMITMDLADINTATDNAAQLTAERAILTGTITLPGQPGDGPIPATLLGALSRFYASPVINGTANAARDTLKGWGSPPSGLSNWYLFALPAPAHAPAAVNGSLAYRGGRYPARVMCQGQINYALCFTAIKLPGGAGPSGFWWGTEFISGNPAGTEMTQKAVVYQGIGSPPTVGEADIQIYQENSGGGDVLEVRDRDGQPIRPDSPVILEDRSRIMPFFGLAIPAQSGPWDAVYPPDLLDLWGESVADRIAGPMPGSEPYAGVEVSASAVVTFTVPGGPADVAGIRQDDEITAIGGKTVTGAADVTSILSAYQPGQTVVFQFIRREGSSSVRHTVKVTLGYKPL